MTKESRYAVYRDYLNRIGIPNRIDEYGELEFSRTAPGYTNEQKFTIFLADEIPEYLSVACHNFDDVSDGMREWWVNMISDGTSNFKVVKLFFEGDTVCAASQIFVPTPQAGCEVLMRCVEAIEAITPYNTRKLYEAHTASEANS